MVSYLFNQSLMMSIEILYKNTKWCTTPIVRPGWLLLLLIHFVLLIAINPIVPCEFILSYWSFVFILLSLHLCSCTRLYVEIVLFDRNLYVEILQYQTWDFHAISILCLRNYTKKCTCHGSKWSLVVLSCTVHRLTPLWSYGMWN